MKQILNAIESEDRKIWLDPEDAQEMAADVVCAIEDAFAALLSKSRMVGYYASVEDTTQNVIADLRNQLDGKTNA